MLDDEFRFLGDFRSSFNGFISKFGEILRILIFYSEYLDFLRESSGEHGSDAVRLGRHSVVDDLANLRLETHVQHSVRFVQHQVAHSAEADQTLRKMSVFALNTRS